MLKTQIIGLIGADAVLNNVNGVQVANFSVCHSEKYKDANGAVVNKSVWISVSWWLKSTNIIPYLKKSVSVYVEGTPSVDTYVNKDGQTVPQLKLRATMVQLLGGNKQDNPQPQAQQPNNGTVEQDNLGEIDSLPF
jgi:single-strand DNA-binding protein